MKEAQTAEADAARLLKNKTLAVAESCTGGLLSSRLTDVPGISKNLKLAIVAYSEASKAGLLDISIRDLTKYGAVSRPIAVYMAKNVRILAGTDIGIGITGIAGPGGGTRKAPVGLVYISISTALKTISRKYLFKGGRKAVKSHAAQAALGLLRKHLIHGS